MSPKISPISPLPKSKPPKPPAPPPPCSRPHDQTGRSGLSYPGHLRLHTLRRLFKFFFRIFYPQDSYPVIFFCQLTVGMFYFICCGVFIYAQNLIVISFIRHLNLQFQSRSNALQERELFLSDERQGKRGQGSPVSSSCIIILISGIKLLYSLRQPHHLHCMLSWHLRQVLPVGRPVRPAVPAHTFLRIMSVHLS